MPKSTMSNAFETQSQRSRIMSPQPSIKQQDYPEVALVPCRWKRSGWKYEKAESKNQFFGSHNRLNSTGYSQFKGQKDAAYPKAEYDEKQRFENTTYSLFFLK